MQKFVILIISVIVIFGCASNKTISNMEEHEKSNNSIELRYLSASDSTIQVVVDSLFYLIDDQERMIDSLYFLNQQQALTIDSLEVALEISNNRLAIDQHFSIPDTIYFAGRAFDLTNERLYSKFEKIYNQEVKNAYKFIPRSGKYFAIFDSMFTEYNIPLDVKYLAIAESQLSPMAQSSVGAGGIWQFMPSTAKGFRMRIDSFVDERRDVFVSTKSAALYLLNSYDYLSNRGVEDWLLTMCAYNAGAGSISKAIKQQEAYDFFDILMKVDETHKYVWRAAAIKLIFDQEEKIFGKKFERQQSLLDYAHREDVKLKGHYKIDDWAKAQGSTIGRILELNPWIKIYKQSRKKYSAVNNVVLPPGEYKIVIPNGNHKDYAELDRLKELFKKENAGFFTQHIVKKGDTLYDIARKYKTSVSKIKSMNALKSNVIYPGQKLRLNGSGTPVQGTRTYVVKSGDTVGGIASKLGISSKWLITMNKLNNNDGIVIIHPGQKLYY
jgi:peptidoglycan lytic transglycosylase D